MEAKAFEAARPGERRALPSDDPHADEVRSVLASRADAGATVVAVDTRRLVQSNLGMTVDEAAAYLRSKGGAMADPVYGSAVFALVVTIGFGAALLVMASVLSAILLGVGWAYRAGGLAGTAAVLVSALSLCVVVAWHRSCRATNARVGSVRMVMDYRDAMRRTVYAVQGDSLVAHALDHDGAALDSAYPLCREGHRAVRHGDHYVLVFSLLDGTLEIPWVPVTPASEALVARFA